jgi:hypothetical protein
MGIIDGAANQWKNKTAISAKIEGASTIVTKAIL